MKRFTAFTTLFAMTLGISLYAAEEIELKDVKCVINAKGDAKAASFREYKKGKVFFCCNNCPKAFETKVKAKDKVVLAKANKQLIQTKQAKQEKCPFTGGPMKTELVVAGAKIKFCCNNCKGKADKMEGDEQIVALFGEEAFKKAGFKVGDDAEDEDADEDEDEDEKDEDEK